MTHTISNPLNLKTDLTVELIHQENVWLEKVQEKLNSSKIGADAEEISEEYDVRAHLVI